MKVSVWYPRGILLAVIGSGLCWWGIFAAAQQPAKWFHHQKRSDASPPIAQPAMPAPDTTSPPSVIVEMDPREIVARDFLRRQAVQLRADLAKYPGLHDQIEALGADILGLSRMSVADPDYPARFSEFYTSLRALYALEKDDAI
jgi:hypothetical protein